MNQDRAAPKAEQIDRKSPRRRVLKGGKIIFGQAQSVLDCTIDNVSEGGAHVRLNSSCALPEEFLLIETTRGIIFRAEAAWRTVDGIGIRLLGPVDDAKQREAILKKFKR